MDVFLTAVSPVKVIPTFWHCWSITVQISGAKMSCRPRLRTPTPLPPFLWVLCVLCFCMHCAHQVRCSQQSPHGSLVIFRLELLKPTTAPTLEYYLRPGSLCASYFVFTWLDLFTPRLRTISREIIKDVDMASRLGNDAKRASKHFN